jgi:gamma-glutamyltranspeptidase/glutathione hydrolase
MAAHGGFVDGQDLAAALASEETAPLASAFGGDEVVTPGPPAGGLTLLHMLRMASFLDPAELAMDTSDGVVRVAAIIARARRDRRRYRLRTGADHAGEAAELLDERRAQDALHDALRPVPVRLEGRPPGGLGTGGETTHVSVMDGEGNVVALTQSIERSFGAAEAAANLGFLYNGYLRTFKVQNRRHPHYMRPGAPARSNAAPTIVMRGKRPVACLGSTGSERMASGLFEVLLRLRGEAPFEAVHAPRLHCTPERHVVWEEERFAAECRERLMRDGFTVENLGAYSF